MNRKANLADNLLLVGVVVVVGFIALGVLTAIWSAIKFAFFIFLAVVAVGLGLKVVNAIGGGDKNRELKR